MSAGGSNATIDDFNINWDFDRGKHGFVGGYNVAGGFNTALPIGYRPVPRGTPQWGKGWKAATAKWYQTAMNIAASGSVMANRYNYYDLDPTYRNAFGQPLMRMTFDYKENEPGPLTSRLRTLAGSRCRRAWDSVANRIKVATTALRDHRYPLERTKFSSCAPSHAPRSGHVGRNRRSVRSRPIRRSKMAWSRRFHDQAVTRASGMPPARRDSGAAADDHPSRCWPRAVPRWFPAAFPERYIGRIKPN